MNEPDFAVTLHGLRAELEDVNADLVRLQRRKQALAQAITGLETLLADDESPVSLLDHLQRALHPSNAPTPGASAAAADYPRGVEAVARVLEDQPGTRMTVREITEELLRRGWVPRSKNPENATSSAAARAIEQYGAVQRERTDSGAYVYWLAVGEDAAKEGVTG